MISPRAAACSSAFIFCKYRQLFLFRAIGCPHQVGHEMNEPPFQLEQAVFLLHETASPNAAKIPATPQLPNSKCRISEIIRARLCKSSRSTDRGWFSHSIEIIQGGTEIIRSQNKLHNTENKNWRFRSDAGSNPAGFPLTIRSFPAALPQILRV